MVACPHPQSPLSSKAGIENKKPQRAKKFPLVAHARLGFSPIFVVMY